jgi:hypothetical protein
MFMLYILIKIKNMIDAWFLLKNCHHKICNQQNLMKLQLFKYINTV